MTKRLLQLSGLLMLALAATGLWAGFARNTNDSKRKVRPQIVQPADDEDGDSDVSSAIKQIADVDNDGDFEFPAGFYRVLSLAVRGSVLAGHRGAGELTCGAAANCQLPTDIEE